jgi:hypothetical protein
MPSRSLARMGRPSGFSALSAQSRLAPPQALPFWAGAHSRRTYLCGSMRSRCDSELMHSVSLDGPSSIDGHHSTRSALTGSTRAA